MRGRLYRIVLIAVILLGGIPAPHAYAQGEAITFGAFLIAAHNKVQQILREAREAGRVVAIEAAIQAQNTITRAQIAYEDSLKLTIIIRSSTNSSERSIRTSTVS